MKNKKKNKKKSIVSGISLKKLPVKINKFYNHNKFTSLFTYKIHE